MARVDGIALATANLTGSLAFYRLLGIDAPSPVPGERYANAVSHGLRLSWTARDSGACGCTLVLRCATPAEVDALAEAAGRAGHAVVLPPFDAAWGARLCCLRDPDGNAVELFAPLP